MKKKIISAVLASVLFITSVISMTSCGNRGKHVLGFGHLITERVDPRTLDSAMNNLAAENDGELPEEMAEVLSVYSELKVSKRKANTKALNRAKKAQEV